MMGITPGARERAEHDGRLFQLSGHGSDTEELVFQDNSGGTKLVSKEAIVQTLVASSSRIRLVFFNACYSASQAEAVVQYVPAAVGMNTAIGDDAARVFAAAFYSAIGFGRSVATAAARLARVTRGTGDQPVRTAWQPRISVSPLRVLP